MAAAAYIVLVDDDNVYTQETLESISKCMAQPPFAEAEAIRGMLGNIRPAAAVSRACSFFTYDLLGFRVNQGADLHAIHLADAWPLLLLDLLNLHPGSQPAVAAEQVPRCAPPSDEVFSSLIPSHLPKFAKMKFES